MAEIIQKIEAIQVALADLQRSGVTDSVGVDVFDFTSESLENTKPLSLQISQTTQIDRQAQTQDIVKKSVAQLGAQERKTLPFVVDDYVWILGESKPVTVIMPTPFSKGKVPLLPEAKTLFEKMLKAIGLQDSDVCYVALKDEDLSGKPHKAAHAAKIKDKVEEILNEGSAENILMIGQSSGKILFSESLSALRKKSIKISGKRTVALCHPNMLLKQPALKRMAWQDLLKFQEGLK